MLPRPAYSNHTSNLPAHIATYMLNHADECPEYVTTAEELLRFAEDQFVTWERPQVYKDVFVPSVAEQYVCGAVNYSVATHMAASARAYQVTGKPIFLAKAQTLADALTQIQHCSNGWYPTWWRSGQDHAWWINCVADCALLMCQVGEMMWAARPASAAPLSQSENR